MNAVVTETRRVEFVGLANPWMDPVIQLRKARRQITAAERRELWKMEQKRQMQGFARFWGSTERIIGIADGLSRDYIWNVANGYVTQMDPHDIEVLMRMHVAHAMAFRVLDDILVVRA